MINAITAEADAGKTISIRQPPKAKLLATTADTFLSIRGKPGCVAGAWIAPPEAWEKVFCAGT
jgi:hypothetical protein